MTGSLLFRGSRLWHLCAPSPDGWSLAVPLLLAGLGSGMVIAPNQGFVLAQVPRRDAGTASAVLGASQRIGSAIGIAVIGAVLFGTLHVLPGPGAVAAAFSHSAQLALLANVGLLALLANVGLLALLLVLALRRQIPDRSR